MKKNKTTQFNYQTLFILASIAIIALYVVNQNHTQQTINQTNSDYLAKGNFFDQNPQNFQPNIPQAAQHAQELQPAPQLQVTLSEPLLRVTCIKSMPANDVILYQCTSKIYFTANSPRVNPMGMRGTLQLIDAQTGQIRAIPLPLRGVKEGINQFTISSPSIGFEQWNVRVCDNVACSQASQNGNIITTIK